MQVGQDDDHLHPPKLLDVVEAVIEHHRQADDHGSPADDRDPYDAAEHDLVEYIRKHRAVLHGLDADFDNRHSISHTYGDTHIDAFDDGPSRRIPLDPSGDRRS